MEYKLLELKSVIQKYWDVPCEIITKITDTAWDVDDTYVLKKYKNKKELERNIILMEILSKRKIPTGEIIKTKNGVKYKTIDETFLLLTRKLRGENILSIKKHPKIAWQMGIIIGNLHNALLECEDNIEIWDNSLLGEMKGWIYETLKNDSWKLISEQDFLNTLLHLEKLNDKLPRQLIHRDVHFGNFLFDDGRFSGYIDFDLSQRNIRIFDICYFLLGLLTEEENKMSDDEWIKVVNDTVSGYDEIVVLTVEEKKAIPYVMLSIEILFAAFYINEGNAEFAAGAKEIYNYIKSRDVLFLGI